MGLSEKMAVFGLIWLIPGAGMAQTTTCNSFGSQITCTQQPGFQPPAPIIPFDLGRAMRANQALGASAGPSQAPILTPPPVAQLTHEQAVEASVGHLIVAGDCPGAIKTALEGGSIDLASHVRAYCEHK